jgi:Fur family peroxide stress response transcriptional regulator
MMQEPMERFVTRCRTAGLVLTPQRLAVFRHLAADRGHPSVEELYATVRRELPTLSLATVYKTLGSLARIGAVRRVSAGSGSRWDAPQESHHHLVCIECGGVSDVFDTRLDALKPRAAALAERHGFAVSAHVVEILGRCATCQGTKRRARGTTRRSRDQRNSHGGKR